MISPYSSTEASNVVPLLNGHPVDNLLIIQKNKIQMLWKMKKNKNNLIRNSNWRIYVTWIISRYARNHWFDTLKNVSHKQKIRKLNVTSVSRLTFFKGSSLNTQKWMKGQFLHCFLLIGCKNELTLILNKVGTILQH